MDNLRPHSSAGLEGSTETKDQFIGKDRSRAAAVAKKKDNLSTNKGAKFAEDGTTNGYDYRQDASIGQGRPQKV